MLTPSCLTFSRLTPIVVTCVLLTASAVHADTLLHQLIDKHIAAKPDFAKQSAPRATDAAFMRRLYLDLTGRIPSTSQARTFLNDKSSDKRVKLIDQLLAGPEYARHMQHTFDVLLMERRPDKHVKAAQWQLFLRTSFAKNKPYDQFVREILGADGIDPKSRAAAKFYLDRLGEPHEITRDVSRLFLGMNLQCAQCHDHPLVQSYKQAHYYGLYAFFNRSYLFNDRKIKKTVYAEKAVGEVSFESVFVPKVTKKSGPRLPGLAAVKEPAFKKGQEYKVKPAKNKRGIPKFSRRALLPAQLAGVSNVRFKRAAANRFWALLIGRGLIHPVDFDHPDNPPSHPQLLELLAEEFAKHKFDVKWLLREIALSETYQRSSRMPAGKKIPEDSTFALAQMRPLTPEQMAWSMMQAVGLIDDQYKALGKKASEAAVYGRLARNVAPFVKIFGGAPGDPADLGFQATLDQTLFLRNGAVVRNWLTPRTNTLTSRLLKAKNNKELADDLFLSVLSRYPSNEERQDVEQFLADNNSNRTTALQELSWALLASAEFRFNH